MLALPCDKCTVVTLVMAMSKGYLRRQPWPLFGGSVTSGSIVVGCCGLSGCICLSGSGLSLVRYSFIIVNQKVVGLLGSLIIQVSPLTVSRSNGLS